VSAAPRIPAPLELATPSAPARTRGYRRGYDWLYHATGTDVPPSTLVPIEWDGLSLNAPGDGLSSLLAVVENVEGWLDSPPLQGNDAALTLADGSAWGPKTLGSRVLTLTGAATGPRDQLAQLRDALASRAASRYPADLTITGAGGGGLTLTASVRGDSDSFKHVWLGSTGIRWSVVLTAADPALYGPWQQAVLAPGGGGATGRFYQRTYTWAYASPTLPNSALLANDGNWPAPVYLLYEGDLTQSTVTDDEGSGQLVVASLAAGLQVLLASDTLVAQAAGGLSRASSVLPGSVPLLVAPQSTTRWHLYASGGGQVTLSWRGAWV